MKIQYLRTCVALASALSLAACGGSDDGTYQLAGAISGLSASGLVLLNNGGDELVVEAGSGSFLFPKLIGQNVGFNVTIKSNPSNATCEVVNGKGTANAYNGVGSIGIGCTLIPQNLSGKVSGLTGAGLVIVNGRDQTAIPAGATAFTMTKVSADGKTKTGTVGQTQQYGLTILTQPAGQTCTIANGVGIMGKTDLDNVLISCL